jgi:hypothetical protein
MPPHADFTGPQALTVCRGARALTSLLGLALAVASGCAQTRVVRPLAPGETVAGVSLGGPLIGLFGAAFPTPILQVGGARGLAERLAVTGNLDLTAALYGTLHLEPGVIWHPVVQGPGLLPSIGLAGSLHLLTDFSAARLAPHVAAVASWPLAGAHTFYAGIDAAVVPGTSTRAVVGPLAGGELRRGSLGLAVELKWLAPYHDVEPAAPSWISPGQRGFLTVLLGVSYHRGPDERPR